ncbi:unnamed protein product, partial [Amoebophrya sp. A120]
PTSAEIDLNLKFIFVVFWILFFCTLVTFLAYRKEFYNWCMKEVVLAEADYVSIEERIIEVPISEIDNQPAQTASADPHVDQVARPAGTASRTTDDRRNKSDEDAALVSAAENDEKTTSGISNILERTTSSNSQHGTSSPVEVKLKDAGTPAQLVARSRSQLLNEEEDDNLSRNSRDQPSSATPQATDIHDEFANSSKATRRAAADTAGGVLAAEDVVVDDQT